jgi:hypothetical protein
MNVPRFLSLLLVTSLIQAVPRAIAAPSPGGAGQRANPDDTRAFFGELHLHTSYSFDAFGFSPSRIDPDAAYRFARGETVNYLGKPAQRHAPLDFMAVTDHAEYMGFLNATEEPGSTLAQSAFGREYLELKKTLPPGALTRQVLKKLAEPALMKELGADTAMTAVWQKTIDAANANYRPGEFTTFIGYEWTSHPDDRYNLHRNVIFRGNTAPRPFSAADSRRPEDLWRYLDDARAHGHQVLAIPHNANASEGHMFDWNDSDGRPIDADYAARRARNEPLVEIYQAKGASETHPLLSPNDEFADFEVMDRLVPRLDLPGKPPGSYAREALGRGLLIERRTGKNPFRFGFVAATDFHNGLTTSAENAFVLADGFDPRTGGPDRATAAQYLAEPSPSMPDPKIMGSGGLTGVWATENTREALFDAMQRSETFGTSGTRIRLRLFAGWHYPADMLEARDWPARAYAEGVPMGSDLPPAPASAAPVFVVWASKAPDGAPLEHAQIIKVWLDGDTAREQVFEVPLPQPRNGVSEITARWQDPAFDARQAAVYYLRVIEVETPRWTTLLADRFGLERPKGSAAMLRERTWSSPIWYRAP